MKAAAETAAVEASTTEASAATAGKTGLGCRKRNGEADNLTECCYFHGER
jgi:hypothetical protein